MLKTILIILCLYILLRFILKPLIRKITDSYLNREKERFYRANPGLQKRKKSSTASLSHKGYIFSKDKQKNHFLIQ
jgi:hypothetical protein